jgi:hypothetical protein
MLQSVVQLLGLLYQVPGRLFRGENIEYKVCDVMTKQMQFERHLIAPQMLAAFTELNTQFLFRQQLQT